MTKLNAPKKICCVVVLCVTTAIASPAQVFTSLLKFDQSDGSNPEYASLVQGRDGNFYGTTLDGGPNLQGTAFKITSAGILTMLYTFCAQTTCTDGSAPVAGLILATDGNLYGTTATGGVYGNGTVFKITPSGTLTTLHSFRGIDGANPFGALIQGIDQNFYGTTYYGGEGNCNNGGYLGCGTIFTISSEGTFTTLYSFAYDAWGHPVAGLIQGTD